MGGIDRVSRDEALRRPSTGCRGATTGRRQRARLDKWIFGGAAPTDPLYLTNRTWGQKIKTWSVIAVPVVILIGGVGFTLSSIMQPPEGKPVRYLSPAEISAKILPILRT